MVAWWLVALVSLSPQVPADAAGVASPPDPTFVERAVRMQRTSGPWWLDATSEGRVSFFRGEGQALTKREALEAVGADALARRQQVAELLETSLPFALCLPLMVPALLGVGLGGLAPSVRGDRLDDILASIWIGGGLGLLVGGLLGLALGAGGALSIQWLRVPDEDAAAAVGAYNRRVAVQQGMQTDTGWSGYFNVAPAESE